MAADLITRAEYKTLAGIPASDTAHDDKLDLLIPMVSDALRTAAGRQFGAEAATETRTFLYDGSGFLDIDDATEVTAVEYGGTTLVAESWTAQPYDGPIFWWLELPPLYRRSPEMGFLRNEDVIGIREPAVVSVTGTFGWTEVPNEVKMAAVWTLAAWSETIKPFIHESIEGYSRTQRLPAGLEKAIPDRALSILSYYDRGPQV